MSLATSAQKLVADALATHFQGILILRRLNETFDQDAGEWAETGSPKDYKTGYAVEEFSEIARVSGNIPAGAKKITIAAKDIPAPRIDGETGGVKHKADVIYFGDWDTIGDAKISTAESISKVLEVDKTAKYNNVQVVWTMTAVA